MTAAALRWAAALLCGRSALAHPALHPASVAMAGRHTEDPWHLSSSITRMPSQRRDTGWGGAGRGEGWVEGGEGMVGGETRADDGDG